MATNKEHLLTSFGVLWKTITALPQWSLGHVWSRPSSVEVTSPQWNGNIILIQYTISCQATNQSELGLQINYLGPHQLVRTENAFGIRHHLQKSVSSLLTCHGWLVDLYTTPYLVICKISLYTLYIPYGIRRFSIIWALSLHKPKHKCHIVIQSVRYCHQELWMAHV